MSTLPCESSLAPSHGGARWWDACGNLQAPASSPTTGLNRSSSSSAGVIPGAVTLRRDGAGDIPSEPAMSESVAEVPGDGSPTVLGETDTSHELLQRLRELEAENSALAQANENQRETYERCLDEVANHVVQALLNQKDLREECIKLKKRVFDLERQNQALSDLFQQKLQLSAGSLPQVTPLVPSGSPGLSPSAAPLDALSPFFKKKAQILEVLRKLEETDPLLGPSLASPGSPEPCAAPGPPASGERVAASPPSTRRGTGGSAPSRRPGKKPPEPGYLPFKERLAALGKLRGAEGREPPGPGRPERGHGAEPRPPPRGSLGGSLKHPEPAHGGEPLARCYSSGSMAARSPHGSPTKLPTKAGAGKTGTPRGEEPVGAKAAGVPHKTPPAPEPPGTGPPPGAAGHSAIEEKVMKGIEENVLRLQGQERAPAGEAKGKAAGGLASWFGLRRSKLPALSRRGDGSRGREWAGTPAPLRREVKLAARKLEAESLNISKLMEKAEDLRKALREEHAFLQGLALEKGRPRGPPRGPGHLPVMYQEVTAETFMQQLLDRVDGKDVPYESRLERKRELCDLRRAPPDTKDPRLCRLPRNGIVGHLQEPPDKGGGHWGGPPPPAPALMPPLAPAACGSLTRTLDSGIGTFPPPDYGGVPAKSTPKPRGRPEPLPGAVPARPPAITKVPRKARTLEREVTSAEELLVAGKHRSAPVCRPPAPPGPQGHRASPQDAGDDAGKPRHVQQSKNWTFPNAKACGTADPFLCPPGGLEGLHRPALAPVCSPAGCRGASPEAPPPLPPALSASSSRTPSASDVGDEGSTEAQSRDGGHGPPGLEHSESLSDSLYDSLSSCGSQG
ncbi:PREDICTED: nck-associated protein 5-like [Haliaeetus leucocephalus]|uniref:nck-associated protein 5-like n=1 Tax=Haliaeetus leucocephalus TaxID=52644 RepID=UPI00053CDC9A|nr:PREDICTED: nck-associated protein 5-like [Haliaeetus leucocephalus]